MGHHRLLLAIVVLAGTGLCSPARGQEDDLTDSIDHAIDRGVTYLTKLSEKKDDSPLKRPGSWALAPGHFWKPVCRPAMIRSKSSRRMSVHRVADMDRVYDAALTLILLDKLADPGDEPFIESLAVRLARGPE